MMFRKHFLRDHQEIKKQNVESKLLWNCFSNRMSVISYRYLLDGTPITKKDYEVPITGVLRFPNKLSMTTIRYYFGETLVISWLVHFILLVAWFPEM